MVAGAPHGAVRWETLATAGNASESTHDDIELRDHGSVARLAACLVLAAALCDPYLESRASRDAREHPLRRYLLRLPQ